MWISYIWTVNLLLAHSVISHQFVNSFLFLFLKSLLYPGSTIKNLGTDFSNNWSIILNLTYWAIWGNARFKSQISHDLNSSLQFLFFYKLQNFTCILIVLTPSVIIFIHLFVLYTSFAFISCYLQKQ